MAFGKKMSGGKKGVAGAAKKISGGGPKGATSKCGGISTPFGNRVMAGKGR